jgi:hypothetical protein
MHDIESEVESLFQQQETPPQFNLRVARRSISDTMCGKLQFVISVEIHEHGHVQLHFQVCNGMVRFVKEEYRTPDGRVVFVDARECAEPGINAPAFGRSPPTGALVSTRSLGGDLGRSQTGGG